MGKLVKYMTEAGWQCTVYTALEYNPSLPADPTLLEEIPDSANVVRIPVDTMPSGTAGVSSRSSFWKRWVSSFLYIPDMRKKWLPSLRDQLEITLKEDPYDCILVSIPPYSLTTIAAELTNQVDIPVILDMRDPWTMNPYKIHPTPLHRKLDLKMEFELLNQIRYGVSAYRYLIGYYKKNLENFRKMRWYFSPNGYDKEDFKDITPKLHTVGQFHIGFSGTFYSHINRPDPLFKAIACLYKKNPRIAEKIRFHHVGKSMIPLKKIARRYGVEKNIKIWGYKKHHECLGILAGMDALCFILDERDPRSRFTIGGKVYEYLRLQIPILAIVDRDGEAAELIRSTHSGCVVPGRDTEALADLLFDWIEEPPSFEYRSIIEYTREHLARGYISFLESVISNHK